MTVIGHGVELVTSSTRPASPSIGTIIYQTDTDEYLKYINYGGANQWMQADTKPNRNVIINSGFDVWQRGTSINSAGGGATTYSADRWAFGNNNASAYTVSRQTSVPDSRFIYSARLTCNNGSIQPNGFVQFIEDKNVYPLREQKITLSFWVRGSTNFSNAGFNVSTGTTANQNPGVGNGFTNNVTVLGDSVNITTSWQYVTATSSSTVPSNAAVMAVYLPKPTFSTSSWVEYAGVQLEIGSLPTSFEFVPYDNTFIKCQRYYQTGSLQYMPIGSISYYSSGEWAIPYAVRMRTTPAATYSGNAFAAGSGSTTAKSGSGTLGDDYSLRADMGGGTWTVWYNGSWTANAEL